MLVRKAKTQISKLNIKISSQFIILITVVLFSLTLIAIPAVAQESTTAQKIHKVLDSWQTNPILKHSHYAFVLSRASDGKSIIAYNPDKLLVPASNLKLVTTATALLALGPDFTFKTSLYYSGEIDKAGTLSGNIHIVGTGDPSLGSERFPESPVSAIVSTWCMQIAKLGIKEITGNVVSEAGAYGYSQVPDTWSWGDIGNYYGAAASGLNISDNTYKVTFIPGQQVGEPATIKNTDPSIPGMTFENLVTTGPEGSGDQACIYGAPYSNHRYVTGTVPKGPSAFTIKGSMPEPALYLAQQLAQQLSVSNITCQGPPTTNYFTFDTDKASLISEIQSPALKQIITQTNLHSINLYAEALFKTIGLKLGGSVIADSINKAIVNFWTKKGLDLQGLHMADGSGLSLLNGITPSQLSQLLLFMAKNPDFNLYLNSLPLAGESGTLKNFCKGTAAAGRLRAKSGTQSRVSCYSGYLTGQKNTLYAFSMMLNSYEGSSKELRHEIERLLGLAATID